jgi:hypothetical protein
MPSISQPPGNGFNRRAAAVADDFDDGLDNVAPAPAPATLPALPPQRSTPVALMRSRRRMQTERIEQTFLLLGECMAAGAAALNISVAEDGNCYGTITVIVRGPNGILQSHCVANIHPI